MSANLSLNPKSIITKLGRKLRRLLSRIVAEESFDLWVREKRDRQHFFNNAFRTLYFNGIDGDYAEFGCCGAMTVGLAFHESRRQQHAAKLWAFDSFKGSRGIRMK